MKVKVDYDVCKKAGECYYNHPTLFKVDSEGYPQVQVDELSTPELQLEAEQAEEVCPFQAISVVDE